MSTKGVRATADDLLAATAAGLTPSTAALHAMSQRFQAEVARSLAGRSGSLKMLQTFARQPRGDERGQVLFVDWGGTHGRAGSVNLSGNGCVELVQEGVFTSSEEEKTAPAFARLERIDRAVGLPLTKGWHPQGLEGRDGVELLAQALERRGVKNVTVSAVANDTVAAMVVHTYRARSQDRAVRPAEIRADPRDRDQPGGRLRRPRDSKPGAAVA